MGRLIKKAQDSGLGQIGTLDETKIAMSFKDSIDEAVDYYEIANEYTDPYELELILEKDKFQREAIYLNWFFKFDGINFLFDYIKQFYGFNQTMNNEIENYLTKVVKKFSNYTDADIVSIIDKNVETAIEFMDKESQNSDNEEE